MSNARTILTTADAGYEVGDLSLFPGVLDDDVSLYESTNNAIAVLVGRTGVNADKIHASDNGLFPDQGIVRIGEELIYYSQKGEGNTFEDLIRGFNATSASNHSVGSLVLGCVSSLHHNSVRDAIIQCERKTGLVSDAPDINGTLTSRVKYLDVKWFTPVARFFAFPNKGVAPLTVNFRNWSLGDPYIEYSWDFGDVNDSTLSAEKHPTHIFQKPGSYTITLNIKSSDGRNAFLSKTDYVKVYDYDSVSDPIAYARDPNTGKKMTLLTNNVPNYDNRVPLEVEFVDQTLGLIQARKWSFGDGTFATTSDSEYDHVVRHIYSVSGIYWPELQILDANDMMRVYAFKTPIVVGLNSKISDEEIAVGATVNNLNALAKPNLTGKNKLKTDIDNLNETLIVR